ncbi:MAG: acyl-CoA thioesterase [Chloroflexota bacterium]
MDSQPRPTKAPISYTVRVQVRYSDLDMLEHVNNAVYLQYVQEAAMRHAEAVGYGYGRMRELGGTFVVRRHEIEYRRAARAGDELLITTRLVHMRGMRATRKTTIVDAASGKLVAEASTDYVWVGNHGRPAHIPADVISVFPTEEAEVQPTQTSL